MFPIFKKKNMTHLVFLWQIIMKNWGKARKNAYKNFVVQQDAYVHRNGVEIFPLFQTRVTQKVFMVGSKILSGLIFRIMKIMGGLMVHLSSLHSCL